MRRATDVAVVEAHDVKTPLGKPPAELLVPRDHLRAEAHDEQRGRIGGIPERLVAECDLPPHVAELLIHDLATLATRLTLGSLKCPSPTSRSCRSTRFAGWRWTPCRRPTPVIRAQRWPSRRSATRCSSVS